MHLAYTHRNPATVVALALLAFVLGSVHAFSVLIEPLVAQFGSSVTAVSAIYSLALVSITVMVSIGHRFYAAAPAAVVVGALSAVAVAGALLAGFGGSLALVWLGYGVLFGTANGAGYGYALQLSAQVSPGREGLAMGGITASYAVGATLFPAIYDVGAGRRLRVCHDGPGHGAGIGRDRCVRIAGLERRAVPCG